MSSQFPLQDTVWVRPQTHTPPNHTGGNFHDFTSIVRELAAPGVMSRDETFAFDFGNVEKPYESPWRRSPPSRSTLVPARTRRFLLSRKNKRALDAFFQVVPRAERAAPVLLPRHGDAELRERESDQRAGVHHGDLADWVRALGLCCVTM